MNDDPAVDSAPASGEVANEESSLFDQEVRELGDLIDDLEKIKEMPDEEFRVVPNRSERRKYEKRNRALKKRKPGA